MYFPLWDFPLCEISKLVEWLLHPQASLKPVTSKQVEKFKTLFHQIHICHTAPYNWQETFSSQIFPREEGKGLNHVPNALNYLGITKNGLLTCLPQSAGGTWHTLEVWWVLKQRYQFVLAWEHSLDPGFSLGRERFGLCSTFQHFWGCPRD